MYMVWSRLEDAKAPPAEIRQAKAAYYQHRQDCPDCSPPVRLEQENAAHAADGRSIDD